MGPVEGDETFPELVRRELAFLVDDFRFEVVSESDDMVRFESRAASVVATLAWNGEVELAVARLGNEEDEFTVGGMVGRASLPRLLELLADELRGEERALRGDDAFFEDLAARQRREAEEWTAYYSGEGPRPKTGKLP